MKSTKPKVDILRTAAAQINPFVLAVAVIYTVLTVVTLNSCYFWDVMQQVSREGYWFYKKGFSSLIIPENNSLNVSATGYHPPLIGAVTALLWQILGRELWVSHAFTAFWAALLIYNSWKLIRPLFPQKYAGWVLLAVLLEPAVLSQFAIASPDFILFTAFVMSLRAVLQQKPALLGFGLFFMCCINMRGIFVGVMLFFSGIRFNYLHSDKKYSLKMFGKALLPCLPALLTLTAYFIVYFIQKGWFFGESGQYNHHYEMPPDLRAVARHLAAFVLTSVEQGRFAVWILAALFACVLIPKRVKLPATEQMLALFVLLMNALYFLFVFISQMPFSPRYFMPQFFVLTLLMLLFAVKYFDAKKIRLLFAAVLFLSISGHFWIYPEKKSKPWDSMLGHLPYYKLRKECFNYIDSIGINYDELTAGFCLAGNRNLVELNRENKVVSNTDMSRRYFIYSNISNLDDETIDELKNPLKWQPLKSFGRFPVFITVYRNLNISSNAK